MENRTNQVIELSNGQEYVILRQIVYKGDTYYVTTEIFEGGDKFDEKITILKETTKDGEIYTTVVTDPAIIKIIYTHIN